MCWMHQVLVLWRYTGNYMRLEGKGVSDLSADEDSAKCLIGEGEAR